MAVYPDDLHYTKDHEWIRVQGQTGVAGITDFAQSQLGDIVHVTMPRVGEKFSAHDTFGEVESVKAVSSLYSPVTGEIVAVNSDLPNKLESLGSDPYVGGWMIKVAISDDSSLAKLMDAAAYEKQCAAEG